MARLTVNTPDSTFATVAVAAASGGDHWKDAGLVRLWISNNHPTNSLEVTVIEQARCNHSHHGLSNLVFTIQPTTLFIHGPFDLGAFVDGQRDIYVNYDFVESSGQQVVFVAAIRS